MSILLNNYIKFPVCIANTVVTLMALRNYYITEKFIINTLEKDLKRKSVIESPFFSKQRMFQIYFWCFHFICDILYVRPINIFRIG